MFNLLRNCVLTDRSACQYVYIQYMTMVDGRCDYEVRAWKNTGGGGVYQKGELFPFSKSNRLEL